MTPWSRGLGLIVLVFAFALALASAPPPALAAPAARPAVRSVTLMPSSHAGAVELLSGERELTTYRATRDTPVLIEVYGPTELLLSTRLEFTPSLRGRQVYVFDVRRDGKPAIAVTFRARRSDLTTYRRAAGTSRTARSRTAAAARIRVPGIADRVRVPVPTGLHRFVIRPRGTTAPGILVTPSIPARDIALGEPAASSPRR